VKAEAEEKAAKKAAEQKVIEKKRGSIKA